MNLANKITIGRILSIPFFVGSIVYYNANNLISRFMPLFIFSVAVISDAVDGFVARQFNQKTELGTMLDPIADKFLIISAMIWLSVSKSLPAHMRVPAWLPILVISRDIIIVVGSVVIHFLKGSVEIMPTIWGKITTFLQMSTVIAVLTGFPLKPIIWNATGLFTVISGIDYIYKGSRSLNGNNGRR